jgi:hypothetical protein
MITEIEFVLKIVHDDADVGYATVIVLKCLASSLCTDTRAKAWSCDVRRGRRPCRRNIVPAYNTPALGIDLAFRVRM